MNIEQLGGRKFLLTVGVIGVATAVELFTARGITESYSLLLAGLVGVYGASNVAITRKSLDATAGPTEELPSSDLSIDMQKVRGALDAQAEYMSSVHEQVTAIAEGVGITNQILVQAMQQPAAQNKPAATTSGLASQALANRA